MNQAEERRAKVALEVWGCRRPDKTHRIDEESAQGQLKMANLRFPPRKGMERSVYRCCEAGWVWGHRRSSPSKKRVVASQS